MRVYLCMQRVVIRTKSVEFMPFFLSLFMFLCATSFCVFGVLGGDPFVAVSRVETMHISD